MPAYFESGFLVGQPAWHSLGKVLKNAPTIEQGIIEAGLDWEVDLVDLQTIDGGEGFDGPSLTRVPARATYRKTDKRVLGVVGPNYHVLQNREAFNWFQPFIDEGKAELHTAGSLHEGEKIWVLAKINLPNVEIVPNDEISSFLLLSNSHNGTTAIRVGFTNIRVVCANTLAMAHNVDNKLNKLIRVRHTSKMEDTLKSIRDVMDLATQTFNATAEQFRFLSKKDCNASDLRKYVKIILGCEETPEADLATRTKNTINKVVQTSETGYGTDLPGVRGTWWGAYNTITEYYSWVHGRTADSRYDSLWYGPNGTKVKSALDLALEMAA